MKFYRIRIVASQWDISRQQFYRCILSIVINFDSYC